MTRKQRRFVMATNRVQMQRGFSIAEFIQQYGSETQCERALAQARWPNGFVCPKCRCRLYTTFARGEHNYWQCRRCRHQTTVKSGTVFASTKLPLTVWFLAMHLLTQAKNNVSALELKRHLGVSYRAAWRIKHKLMQAMVRTEARRQLTGRIEIDDAYLGGECPGTPGRGSPNKIPFVIGVSTRQHKPHQVAIQCMAFTKEAISDWANQALHADTQVWSDGLPAFRTLAKEVADHRPVVSGSGRAAVEHPEFRCVNIVLGNLKTAITGTYHAFKFGKYAPRYLAEFQYRFNRRYDLRAILPNLIRTAATTKAWPEAQLRLAEFRA